MIVTEDNVQQILDKLSTQSVFVIDIEASGLGIMYDDFMCGVGIATANREAFYFPFRHSVGINLDEKYIKEIIKILEGSILIGHNIKYDLKGLYREGLNYKKCFLIDTIVMARLCSSDKAFSLDLNACSERFIGEGSSQYKKDHKVYLKKNKIKKHSDADPEFEGEYCCKDLMNTLQIFEILNKQIKVTNQTDVWLQECKLTKTLLNMEIYGVRIDLEYCARSVDSLTRRRNELEQTIYELVGCEFNIDSPKQLSKSMKKIDLESPVKTKTGADSWNAKALALVEHPIIDKILEFRAVGTLLHTFFEPQLERGSEIVCTSFKNWKAITGRLSCEDPNLQNIPKSTRNLSGKTASEETDEELMKVVKRVVASGGGGRGLSVGINTGKEAYDDEDVNLVSARRLFVPRDGTQLFSIDTKQMEVAVLCYYGKEEELLKRMFEGGFDFHRFIAIEALGADVNDPNFDFFREISKGVTFGVIYGMGDDTLAKNLGKSKNEAKMFKHKYLGRIPGAKLWMDDMKERANNGEVICNDYGRRYLIPIGQEYKIINYMVQGTAGEIIKECMNTLDIFLADKKTKMLVQIHDELLFEVHDDERYLLKDIVKIMRTNKLGIPLNMDVKICEGSWANKRAYDIDNN